MHFLAYDIIKQGQLKRPSRSLNFSKFLTSKRKFLGGGHERLPASSHPCVSARIETSLRRQADKIDIHRVNNEAARSITFHKRSKNRPFREEYKETLPSFLSPFLSLSRVFSMYGISTELDFCLRKCAIYFFFSFPFAHSAITLYPGA